MSGARMTAAKAPEPSAAPLGPEGFRAATGVSRETLDRLEGFAALLVKWQKAINLVAADSLADMWRRHFLDSAQLWPLAPPGARVWVDLGSGAGFPGLVLAIMGAPEMHLIESDGRKCAFLLEAARATDTKMTVHRCRIEAAPPLAADVVTARALAPLSRLLELAAPFLRPGTVCLFLKGQDVERELTEAAKCWNMQAERLVSRSNPAGVVLRLRECRRV